MNAVCFGSQDRSLQGEHLQISETHHPTGLRTPAHAHDALCLHVVLDGAYEESTRAGSHRLARGMVLYKPPETVHWNHFGSGSVTLRIELLPWAFPALMTSLPGRVVAFDEPFLSALAGRAHRELRCQDQLSPIVAESLGLEILAGIARRREPKTSDRTMALAAAAWIDDHYSLPVTLSDVADAVASERTVLAKAFRAEHGCSVGEYIRHRRVEHVWSQIRSGCTTGLASLAHEAGFSDQSHMTRLFKKTYGITPGALRRAH